MGEEQPGKYARWERERRFLVERWPEEATLDEPVQIIDRYLPDCRLRLRQMIQPDGSEAWKLTQKVDGGHAAVCATTNIYLDEPGWQMMRRLLPGMILTKQRYRFRWQDRACCLDVFSGALEGLELLEVQVGADELDIELELPFAGREVTDEPTYRGRQLAELEGLGTIHALHAAWEKERAEAAEE